MITKDSSNVVCWVQVFWDATIFCNNFARWLQKIVATWCIGFFWDVLGFLGCVGFSGMLLSFVTSLQDDTKKWHRMLCQILLWSSVTSLQLWSFVTSLQVDTIDSSNMWLCWLMCWVFWDVLVFWDAAPDAMIFCNNFARWLQKIVDTSWTFNY